MERNPGVRLFDEGKEVSFKFGLIGSTDNHKARAGSGYKEFAKKAMGDSWGANDRLTWLIAPERGASFYSTGGLVAVHAKTLDNLGYKKSRMNACGYSLGATFSPTWMDVPPMIYSKNPLILKPGMVFFVHIILMDSDVQLAMNLGETYLITENGNERLGKQKLDLVIL